MKRSEFLGLLQSTHEEIVDLNKTKGHDYAGDEDALRNFKAQAVDAGVSPEQVWLIFFGKHMAAIHTYVREGQVASEPVQGRIKDAILYLYLLLGLVEEIEQPVRVDVDALGRAIGGQDLHDLLIDLSPEWEHVTFPWESMNDSARETYEKAVDLIVDHGGADALARAVAAER